MIHRMLFFILCLSLFFLDSIPNNLNFGVILFVSTLFLFLIVYPEKYYKLRINRTAGIFFILIFLLFLFILSLSIFVNNNPISDVIRAAIPFIFILLSIPFFLVCVKLRGFDVYILKVVIFVCTVFSLYNVYLFVGIFLKGVASLKRITLLDPITTAPWPLFGAVVLTSILINNRNQKYKFSYIVILIINILGFGVTLTRSMILVYIGSLLIIVLLKLLLERKITFLIKSILTLITFVFTFTLSIRFVPFINALYQAAFLRFTKLNSGDINVSERVYENDSAMEVLISNPLIGGGLGLRFSQSGIGEYVNYIHNGFFYALANIGLIGTFLIIIIITNIIIRLLFSKDSFFMHFGYGLIALSMYSLFFATFKLIHHNFLIAICFCMFALLLNRKGENIKI